MREAWRKRHTESLITARHHTSYVTNHITRRITRTRRHVTHVTNHTSHFFTSQRLPLKALTASADGVHTLQNDAVLCFVRGSVRETSPPSRWVPRADEKMHLSGTSQHWQTQFQLIKKTKSASTSMKCTSGVPKVEHLVRTSRVNCKVLLKIQQQWQRDKCGNYENVP